MRLRSAVVALALTAISSAAGAQSGFWWGGIGLSVPSGNTSDGLKSGWLGSVGVGWDLPSKGWSLQAEGYYATNSAKSGGRDVTMTGLLGNLAYDFNADDEFHPYLYAGLGMISSKASGGKSNSDVAMQASGGLSYKVKDDLHLWAEIRYLNVGSGKSGYTTIPIVAGFSMPWGKK